MGKRDTDTQLEDLGRGLSQYTREVLMSVQRQLHELARQTAIAKTPEGGAGDKHPGLMRRSWVDIPGSIESAIAALQPTKIRNVAPHGLIIDRGRRKSENAFTVKRPGATGVGAGGHGRSGREHTRAASSAYYTVRAGKMLGSPQAPLGIKGDVLRALRAAEDSIAARADAEAERKVKG